MNPVNDGGGWGGDPYISKEIKWAVEAYRAVPRFKPFEVTLKLDSLCTYFTLK